MHLRSDSFTPYATLAPKLAFGRKPADGPFAFGDNCNPHLAWSEVPEGTKSFALLCWDPDVPTKPDDVNQEGRTVPLDLPRTRFVHWVVADLPADLREIAEGAHSSGIVPRGKKPGPTPDGGVQGENDYTGWFASDDDMAGSYCGYDGPCPPFNDERIHGYRFQVFALDVPTLGLSGNFTASDLEEAMSGHILAQATLTGLYHIYPSPK